MDSFVADKAMVMYSTAQAWTFWTKLVIQTSETQSCIRHSIAALSKLHEWNDLSRRTPWQNTTFTGYYTKAITEINSSQSFLPVEIVLISCILFAHCEFLMGASAAGLLHLKSGYRIISEHRKKQLPLSAEVSEQMEPIMKCFLAKAEYYSLKEEVGADENGAEETTYISPEMVHTFQDLTEANKHVEHALYWVLLLDLGQPHYFLQKIPAVRKYVNDWATAFGRWKADLSNDETELKDWQLLLLSHHRMALLLLRSLPPENDKTYGRAASDFRVMFAQLRTFLRNGHPSIEQPESKALLKMHLGYIAPLFFIATQCRLSDIRRNALGALKDLKVAEGRWNSCIAYIIAKAILEIEESLADTSPARSTRVKIESVGRAGDGTLLMKYHKVPARGTPDDAGSLRMDGGYCIDEPDMKWVCEKSDAGLPWLIQSIASSACSRTPRLPGYGGASPSQLLVPSRLNLWSGDYITLSSTSSLPTLRKRIQSKSRTMQRPISTPLELASRARVYNKNRSILEIFSEILDN